MKDRWSDDAAEAFVARYRAVHGEDLALRAYTSQLLGAEPALVLHGGGNTSVKGSARNLFGDEVAALFVKASGHDLAGLTPDGLVAVALEPLRRLRELDTLDEAGLAAALRGALFHPDAPTPSIEAPVHAALPARFVDHSHADAVLALTNQPDGEALVRAALGSEVIVLPYAAAGFALAKQVARAIEAQPDAHAMVWMRHGIVTWGDSARSSYARMIELVSRAEAHLRARAATPPASLRLTSPEQTEARLARVAPLVRGRLAVATGDADQPYERFVLRALIDAPTRELLDAEGAREITVSPPLTGDHLIRTKPLPVWIDAPAFDDAERLGAQLDEAIARYAADYRAYFDRHAGGLEPSVVPFDPLPRSVLLPGLGVLCAGRDAAAADIVRDIARQTLAAKRAIAAMGGTYEGLAEPQLFEMEYRGLQLAKLRSGQLAPLQARVVMVTGAAGAIGSGICHSLLGAGAHVVATDLAGEPLDRLVEQLEARHPGRALGAAVDVTDADSIAAGFDAASCSWGGVDQLVVNAGLAHVASLEELTLDRFRALQRVNTDGTLLLLAAAARHLRAQGTGGDVVLISTKNVFAPGARFGAYSATKAAAHQLARIASLELAEHDIRVNMVAPDAVFSHGERASGLWAEVGPDRMKTRGLDADGLEAYYRDRNLLKARITADHVANAVLFFLTRQTPTTGATIPVDGGLPDATPR